MMRLRLAGLSFGALLAIGCHHAAPEETETQTPVAVAVDPKTTAYLVLDLTSVICTPRKSCVASLPAAAALLKKARDAKALVVYSDTASAGSTILPEVAQQARLPHSGLAGHEQVHRPGGQRPVERRGCRLDLRPTSDRDRADEAADHVGDHSRRSWMLSSSPGCRRGRWWRRWPVPFVGRVGAW